MCTIPICIYSIYLYTISKAGSRVGALRQTPLPHGGFQGPWGSRDTGHGTWDTGWDTGYRTNIAIVSLDNIRVVSWGQEPHIFTDPYETSLSHMQNENEGYPKKRDHIGNYQCNCFCFYQRHEMFHVIAVSLVWVA